MPRSVKFDRVGDQDHGSGGSDDGSEDGVMMMGPRPMLDDEEVDELTVYVGESGAPCPIARRLESEVGEVAPAIALAPDERSTTGSRLSMNGNAPNAYKILEQVGRSMVATSAWMMMFGPKRIGGAKWVTLEKELSSPIDSSGLTQLAEQTKRLLEAMGFEYTDIPSKVSLQVWDVGDNTLTWPGFQTTSTKRELFSKFAESPYSMGSHMVTPKKSLGGRRIYDGTDDVDDNDNTGRDYADACEGLTAQTQRSYHHVDDDGAQRIKLTHHISLSKLPKFNGRRIRTEHALKWLRVFIYEMQGTNTSQDCWHVPFELCMEDGASYWIRQLPQGTRTRWPQLCEAFKNYYGTQYHEAAKLKYYTAQQELGEHICDYMLRLNGYARSANIIYDKGGAAGARHVKQFLTTCCDGDMVTNIIPQRFDNIADVEVVINEILAAERRHRDQRNYVQMLGSTNARRRYFRSTHHGPHSGRNNRIRICNAKIAEIPEERLMITQHSEDVHDDYGRTINQSRVSCKSDSASDGLPADSVNYLNGLCSRQPHFSSRSESHPAQPPQTRPIRGLYRTGNENGLREYTFRSSNYGPFDDLHSPLPDKPAVEANFVLAYAHRSRGQRQDEERRPNHYTLAPIKKVSESAILESNEPVGECTHMNANGLVVDSTHMNANGLVVDSTHMNANGWVGELRPPIMPKPIRLRDGERRGQNFCSTPELASV
ncbi:unnamed protein product [Phytophthora fragariaefolia]|uniref:Unnamed protein product n=1 Tax=Phytophthora fragariaefolia TaxID=1490495 RepID=A0A9W6XVP1_9STRA|nr:unnamed protein product [Phytophthora fragariaefolia]